MIPNHEFLPELGDITQCNTEQIHLSGAVQGHGCLLFFTPDFFIQGASLNAAEFLKTEERVLGNKLDYVLESHFLDMVKTFLKAYSWKTPGLHLEYRALRQTYDVYLFQSEGTFGLEFEIAEKKDALKGGANDGADRALQNFMHDMKEAQDVTGLSNLLCRYVREVAGIDRVMMYKFIPPTWYGEVIGEDRVIGSHSFMNHRFPASDIPKPARDLYLRNKVRLIPNVQMPIVPLDPPLNPLTEKKWDLTDSRLRSVSPIHIEYLKNMGIEGSMSFAVIVQGELWGLIACHHLSAYSLSNERRSICMTMADAFAAQVTLLESLQDYIRKSSFERNTKQILGEALPSKKPLTSLFRQSHLVMDAFNATGMALINEATTEVGGVTPPVSILKSLGRVLQKELQESGRPFLAVQNVSEIFPEWTDKLDIICGALCVKVDDKNPAIFVIFRPEVIQHIYWGGDPVKKLDRKNFKGQINPRKSFETWEEVIRHQSLEWQPYEIDGILFLKEVLFDSLLAKNNLIDELYETLQNLKGKK